MSFEKVYNHPAYVLHIRPYKNTSVLVDLLTKDFGRFTLIAKGIKQAKSQLKSALQLFQCLSISWHRKSELGILIAAEHKNDINQFSGKSLYLGLYANELINRIVPINDNLPEVYECYSEFLFKLQHPYQEFQVLREFEMQLLKVLGYEISLRTEVNNNRQILPEKTYQFIPEHGFTQIENDSSKKICFKGEHILAFASGDYTNPAVLKTAKYITQSSLQVLIGDSRLESRELYKAHQKNLQKEK